MSDTQRLSLSAKFTTLWVFIAMILGIALGASVPGLPSALDSFSWGRISIPIAVGLIWMM